MPRHIWLESRKYHPFYGSRTRKNPEHVYSLQLYYIVHPARIQHVDCKVPLIVYVCPLQMYT